MTSLTEEGTSEGTRDGMTAVLNSLLGTRPDAKLSRKRKREKKIEEVVESSDEEEQKIVKKGQTTKDAVNLVHTLPDSIVWEYEQRLKQVATRGMVKLFNAVNKQQKKLQSRLDAVGSSENKRSKVLSGSVGKKEFLSMLKGGQKVSNNQSMSKTGKLKKKEGDMIPNWSLLRDDTGLETAMESWQDDDNNNPL